MTEEANHLILVVEDDCEIRESLRELLVDEGYGVLEAGNGVEALKLLENQTPSLILLDLWMPVMTGRQLFVQLRAEPRWSAIPVVVVTAANDPPPADEVETLQKPLRLETLLSMLERYLPRR